MPSHRRFPLPCSVRRTAACFVVMTGPDKSSPMFIFRDVRVRATSGLMRRNSLSIAGWRAVAGPMSNYGVEIKPLLVATTRRLPQRTIESTLPTPGTVCPGITFQTPLGPSNTAVPLTTSRSVQPSIVVGRVSGVGVSWVVVRTSFALTSFKVVCRGAPVDSLVATRDSGEVLTEALEAEETIGCCGASAGTFRAISRTIISPI